MKLLVYSAKHFEIPFLTAANKGKYLLHFTEEQLTSDTAMQAVGCKAISIFSADDASTNVLEKLKDFGVKYITLRSAGHDNINAIQAKKMGFKVANAPDYSPHAIAEHAMTLLLALNRKIVLANQQIQNGNFSLDNLVGFDLNKKTIGILGTGRIGSVIAKIAHGFGCKIIANDTLNNPMLEKMYDVEYISKDAICKEADIIIISLPLTSITHYLVDEVFLQKLKKGTIIVNIARGAIVKTAPLLDSLNSGELAGYATDVYEKESGIFFYNHSHISKIKDKQLIALMNHPKALLSPHQAFATQEALKNIADTTFHNIDCWKAGKVSPNELAH